MRKKTVVFLLVFAVLFSCGGTFFVTRLAYQDTSLLSADDGLQMQMDEISWYIQQFYYKDAEQSDLELGALKGMVTALNDPYSAYYTMDEYMEIVQEDSGEYAGIGVTVALDPTTGYPRAEIVHNNTPAQEAGVQEGDLFIAIDGEEITPNTDITLLAQKLRGQAGTQVAVTVLRNAETLEITITRANVTIDRVEYRMLDNQIGYMRITEFTGNALELFHEAIAFFEVQGAQGIVLDLRSNPGGYLDYAVEMADTFLPSGVIVTTKTKEGKEEEYTSDAQCLGLPLAVIINEGSASASEVLTGALVDYDVAITVGTTSYGKALVQRYYPLSDSNGVLKLTIASYLTPNGTDIGHVGITPQIIVEESEDGDAPLEAAVQALQTKLAEDTGE